MMNTSQTFCHSGSVENYLSSPKMPVKDHMEGLRSTQSSFKIAKPLIDEVKNMRYRIQRKCSEIIALGLSTSSR